MKRGWILGIVFLTLLASFALAINIKDISIAPSSIEVGSSAEILVIVDSDLKSVGVGGFITYPDGSESDIKFETKDDIIFTYLFENAEKVGGYGINVVASDEKESTKAFAKFEVVPVSEPPPAPINVSNTTFVDYIKNVQNVSNVRDVQFTQKVVNQTTMFVGGTEYMPYDEVKVFLQLLQGDAPVNNASCYVSIYYPNNTLWQNNQSMIYQNGTNGLYWWSGIAPNVTGVYMVDSRCRYDYFQRRVYPKGTIDKPVITTTSGAPTGSILSINDYEDSLYLQHLSPSSAGHYVDFYADFNITDSNYTATQIDIYWLGQSSTTDKPLVLFYAWNWTSSAWVLLPNNITLYGTKSASIEGVNELVTNTLTNGSLADYVSAGKMVRIRVLASYTTNYYIFTNWFSLGVTAPTNMYLTDIRGGGEIHITSPAGQAWWTSIITWLSDIWNKLLGIETQLNTTINITTNINTTANLIKNDTTTIINKIDNLNTSMQEGFAEKEAHIQNAYDNVTSQITNLSQDVSSDFNYTWSLIQQLNQTNDNSQVISYLQNITLALNNTQTQIANINNSITNTIISVNSSLSTEIISSANATQTQIQNLNNSNQLEFEKLESMIDNLTIQVNQNQNITQQNITDLTNLILSLNLSINTNINNLNTTIQGDFSALNDTLIEMKSEISNIENMTLIMNQTTININNSVTWIINYLNISTENLTLVAEAPSKCLEGTNWLLKAQVRDRFGVIQSPMDNMECNATTDLWGTANMSYSYVEQKFKYLHVCENATQTFNWSVSCDYII